MKDASRISRRGFMGALGASALSFVYLPGVGRVRATPAPGPGAEDYYGRLCFNENPLGPSPDALAAMQDAATLAHRYPNWINSATEAAIAEHHGLTSANVCVGAGATEIIRLVADAFLGPGDELVTATPTYSQMGDEAWANGATVVHVPLDAEHVIDLDGLLGAVGPDTRMVSLVNPNNPVATIVDRHDLENFLAALPPDILVVVDEAYHDYVHSPDYESCIRYIEQDLPMIVIRTLSKAYGLAGARIGYALAASSRINLISGQQLYATVSRPSQAAALAALADPGHVAATVDLNDEAMAALEIGFAELGLVWIPSVTNFVMVDVGTNASAVAMELGSMGYQVRTGWGMPQHLRVSTGTLEEMTGFLAALQSILESSVPEDPDAPRVFGLSRAFPNPFNGTCRIIFSVADPEPVRLLVYDAAGRKVRSLFNGKMPIGSHFFVWDGRDHAGREVPSGQYLVALFQGEQSSSSRVTLIK